MKYFEVIEPYYALIKAANEEEAIKVYVENVACDEPDLPIKDEIKEVDQDYALAGFAKAPGDTKDMTVEQLLKEFNNGRNEVLLIDGSLI